MSTRFTHVTLAVTDIDRSIAFYGSWCGMAVVRDRRGDGGGTVWLAPASRKENPPLFVLVLVREAAVVAVDHLGFQVESRDEVDALARRAEAGTLVAPPRDAPPPVGYFVQVRDPDGHIVEFTFGQPLVGL